MFKTILQKFFIFSTLFLFITGASADKKYAVIRSLGDENAPVVLHEFSSMTCPHCARFHATAMKKLKKDYIDTGKVRLVMHQFPLDDMAIATAMLGLSLPEENYFGFIEYAFANQQLIRENPLGTLESWAKMSGLDLNKILANQDLQVAIIRQKNTDQRNYDIQGTPTLYFNDTKTPQYNAQKPEIFFKALDKTIAKAR